MKQIEKSLGDSKYLCGDTITIYDCQIAGHFYNQFLNRNSKHVKEWGNAYNAHCPARVKKYIEDFGAEFKPYLDERGYKNTM